MIRGGDRRPLSDRRLREIGDWGEAGRYIGTRWESLGLAAFRAWAAAEHDDSIVIPVAADEAIQAIVSRLGLTNPDVVLSEASPNGPTLRPVDLKWTLDLANYTQISADALSGLLTKGGDFLRTAFGLETAGADPNLAPARTADGFFVSPPTEGNRLFLTSAANRRQEYPIEPREVVFLPVEPAAVFADLPGWDQALVLARLDRVASPLASLDLAEWYFRLGAGVAGAIVKLATPLFAETPAVVDVPARLTESMRESGSRASLDVVHYFEPGMARRQTLVVRLRGLLRPPVSVGALAALLERHGIVFERGQVADPAVRQTREPWLRLHRELTSLHRQRVLRFGRELVKRNFTDEEAIERIATRLPEFEGRSRAEALKLIAQALNR